jgi:hypothetical protein
MLRRRNWEGIFRAALNPSMEAAGKTLRCAVPAARKPGVAIPDHPRDACVAPCFSRPGKSPPNPGSLSRVSFFVNTLD